MGERQEAWREMRRWHREEAAVPPANRIGLALGLSALFVGAAIERGRPDVWGWVIAAVSCAAVCGLVLAGIYDDWSDARRRLVAPAPGARDEENTDG